MNEQNKPAEPLFRFVNAKEGFPKREGDYNARYSFNRCVADIRGGKVYEIRGLAHILNYDDVNLEYLELLEEIPAPDPSLTKEKEGEQPEVPEEIMQFIFKNSRGYGGDCYIIAACVKLYHKMQEEMPGTENPTASYWFEKARTNLVERNEFKAKVSRLHAEIQTLREEEKYNASLIDQLKEQLKGKHDEAQEYRNLLKNIYDQGDLSGLCRSAQKDLNIVLEKYPIS